MTTMKLGAQIPAWHWDYDARELRDLAQGMEAIGYDWMAAPDHVLYAYETPERPPIGPYVGGTLHHELMTLLAFVAACTSRLVLQATVLVLPQREPVLVAKQAAELDVLSEGRFELGVGLGWNEPEFAGLGAAFKRRVSRLEEAVAVLRACWSQEPITFHGRYTMLEEMSMLPKPVTAGGPPLFFGAMAPKALERTARLGDGWIAQPMLPPDQMQPVLEQLQGHLKDEGKDPLAFPMQAAVRLSDDLDAMTGMLRAYRDLGFTRLGLVMPSFRPQDKAPVEEYLGWLARVHDEVWPLVVGGSG